MRWFIAVLLFVAPAIVAAAEADAVKGRDDFVKYRCNVCHSVAGQKPAATVPLRDLSREKPEAVANLIVARTHLAPEALFDQMAMSSAASQLSQRELMDIVAYLRRPSAAAQKRQSEHR
jgi:cytochrome c553